VHSVLWLILAFLSTSGLFVLLGAEFVAMLLVIVYVGAVAVLFLFVVMMLDIDFAALKGEMARYMPLGLLIGVVLLMQLAIGVGVWSRPTGAGAAQAVTPDPTEIENTRRWGCCCTTVFPAVPAFRPDPAGRDDRGDPADLRHRKDVKRQNVLQQMWRDPAKAMELKDVKPGQGL
jgi:NADH-quinone oxidoreductase subunit J